MSRAASTTGDSTTQCPLAPGYTKTTTRASTHGFACMAGPSPLPSIIPTLSVGTKTRLAARVPVRSCGSPCQRTTVLPYGQRLNISPSLQGLELKHFGKLLTVRVNRIKVTVRPGKVPESTGKHREKLRGDNVVGKGSAFDLRGPSLHLSYAASKEPECKCRWFESGPTRLRHAANPVFQRLTLVQDLLRRGTAVLRGTPEIVARIVPKHLLRLAAPCA